MVRAARQQGERAVEPALRRVVFGAETEMPFPAEKRVVAAVLQKFRERGDIMTIKSAVIEEVVVVD